MHLDFKQFTLDNFRYDLGLAKEGILDIESLFHKYNPIDHAHVHRVTLTVHDKDGNLKHVRHTKNLRTNKGGHDQAATMIGLDPSTSLAVAGARYMALSNAIFTPNTVDTTLQGEISSSGLARVLAVASWVVDPASTNPNQLTTAQGTYKLVGTWTASASVTGVTACGIFNAASTGDLWFEATFGSVNVNSGDTVTLTYTINY